MLQRLKDKLRKEHEQVLVELLTLRTEQFSILKSGTKDPNLTKNNSKKTSDLVYRLLAINSSRHQTMGSDVEYINQLDYKYFTTGETDNLLKSSEIIIYQDYIEITDIKLSRRNEIDLLKFSKGTLFLPETKTMYFSLEGMMQYIKSCPGIGVPTDNEWRAIIKAIPGNTKEEITDNLKGILNLTCTGICSHNDGKDNSSVLTILEGFEAFGAYWSGDSILGKQKRLLYFENGMNTIATGDFENSMVALRCKLL